MTDQQAFEMGLRWLDAGFKASRRTKWMEQADTSDMPPNSPDPRDPGNKGHAVAQLRERTGDQYLTIQFHAGHSMQATPFHPGFVEPGAWHAHVFNVRQGPHPTEEEAITAALEATKP
jgi:hypothetical protein